MQSPDDCVASLSLPTEIKTLELLDYQTSDNYIKDFGEFSVKASSLAVT